MGYLSPLPLQAAERNLIAQSDTFLVRPKISLAVLSSLHITVEDGEEQQLWNGFMAAYDLEVADRREHIAQLLVNNPSIRALYNNSVYPSLLYSIIVKHIYALRLCAHCVTMSALL